MPTTYIRVRQGEAVKLMPVVASYKHASGHVFVVHRSLDNPTKYGISYAPVGLAAVGSYASINAALDAVARASVEIIDETLARQLQSMADVNWPVLSSESGIEYADIWQAIERNKFASGEYKSVPELDALGFLDYPSDHFLHLSVTELEDDYVAYTPSESYGRVDRQVRLRFGKYLRKTFSKDQLTDSDIQAAVTELRAKLARSTAETLDFATDIETINEIFETRMNPCGGAVVSCMYGKWNEDSVRPYHVYAESPDVAVAYVRRGDSIVARSVVSTKDKIWIRAYSLDGCETLCGVLREMLKAVGYRQGSLKGNRLTKRGSLMPYIDLDDQSVDDGGKYWIVASGEDGEYLATNTDGSYEYRCSSCERPEDDCNCSYCACCEERYADGCDTCNMCQHCDGCRTHGGCACEYCENCNELREHHRGLASCDCDRCEECGELEENCECEEEEEAEQTRETPPPETSTEGASV